MHVSGTGEMMPDLKTVQANEVILRILHKMGEPVHSTKLVKLTYLVDSLHYQHYGRTMTGFQYMWDHFGPNAVGHAIVSEAQGLVRARRAISDCYPNIFGGQTIDFQIVPDVKVEPLPPHAEMLVEDVIAQYGKLSVEAIAEVTKQTEPFKTAAQYSILSMKHSAPAVTAMGSQWEKHRRAVEEQGMLSLAQIRDKYGL
jgi:uncharacterized phage-associated protein